MNLITSLILLTVFTLFTVTNGLARDRVALVIGNGAYQSVSFLPNPTNDADILGETLSKLGFEVTVAKDLTRANMSDAITRFGAELLRHGKDSMGFFFYAGHAVQLQGANFLLPIDANIASQKDVASQAIHLEDVAEQLRVADIAVSFMVIDACRDNPFDDSVSFSNGLAQIRAPWRSIVAYSTEPGGVALDGDGLNSPYTAALTEEIQVPGVPAEHMFKRVRRRLLNETNALQISWESSSLTEDIFFVPDSAGTLNLSQFKDTRPKHEVDWENMDWGDLTNGQRQLWANLGWYAQNWEDETLQPDSERKIWDRLTAIEQKSATALGYSKHMWDGTEELELNLKDDQNTSVPNPSAETTTQPDWEELAWQDLTGKQQKLWAALGWNSKSWSGSSAPPNSENRRWDELDVSEKRAATALGFSSEQWDSR